MTRTSSVMGMRQWEYVSDDIDKKIGQARVLTSKNKLVCATEPIFAEVIVGCVELVASLPCQQMMTVEDCNVAIAQHVRHPERYEKLPKSEWCERCRLLDLLDVERSAE